MVKISRRIAAMSKWRYPYTLTPDQEANGVGVERLPATYAENAIVELSNEFLQKLFDGRTKYLDHNKDYCRFLAFRFNISSIIPN